MPKIGPLNPKYNHISFQCECVATVEKKLKEMKIEEYVKGGVEDGGIHVDQLFFHDPDGNMIEVCNCDNLPVVPLLPPQRDAITKTCSLINCANNIRRQRQQQQHQQSVTAED